MRSCRVIRVAPEDDIMFIVNRVKEAAGEALCLALSVQCTQFRNDMNLRLLTAYAREAEVDVALSTDDEESIACAAVHGIPTYRTPDLAFQDEALVLPKANRAPKGAAAPAGVPAPGQGVATRFAPVIVVLLIASLATVGTAFALLPRVEIEVVPTILHHPVRLHLPVAEFLIGEAIPVTSEVRVEATGTRVIGEGIASGRAIFINSNEFAVTVPAGTFLHTDGGQTFRTLESVVVPAQVTEMYLDTPVGSTAGRAEVLVEATVPGSGGNVPEGSIRSLDGAWPGLVVRNAEALSGGSDREVIYVTTDDLERGYARAAAALQEAWDAALAEYQAVRLDRWIVAVESLGSVTYGAEIAPGEEVAEFAVTAQAMGWIESVDQEVLEREALARIEGDLPDGFRWLRSASHEIRMHWYNKEEQVLELEIFVPIVASFDTVSMARQLAGRGANEATAYLEELPGVETARVVGGIGELPAWAPWIGFHILDPEGGGDAH